LQEDIGKTAGWKLRWQAINLSIQFFPTWLRLFLKKQTKSDEGFFCGKLISVEAGKPLLRRRKEKII
jgi:hypothetical protein